MNGDGYCMLIWVLLSQDSGKIGRYQHTSEFIPCGIWDVVFSVALSVSLEVSLGVSRGSIYKLNCWQQSKKNPN